MKGETIGEIELSDDIFGIDVNENAMYLAVQNQLANRRQGHIPPGPKAIRGSGRKPYRQKRHGGAHHGSIRSAQWVKAA